MIAASTTLRGAAARTAATALDRAGPGPSPDVPATDCLPGAPEDTPVILHVERRDGSSLDVRVRFSSCADRWVASPHGVSQVTQAQLKALLGGLGYCYGWTDLPGS